MANLTITISNGLNFFGPQPTNNWGSVVWGVDSWAYSSHDLPTIDIKSILNSLSLSNLTTTLLDLRRTITNSISIAGDMTLESLIDAAGYSRIFGESANAEDRPNTGYTKLSDQTAAFIQLPETSTTWTRQ